MGTHKQIADFGRPEKVSFLGRYGFNVAIDENGQGQVTDPADHDGFHLQTTDDFTADDMLNEAVQWVGDSLDFDPAVFLAKMAA